MKTKPCKNCLICGCEGRYLYLNQEDRLFGVPGSWNFRICSNAECGLIWLDPMLETEDIGEAYLNYFTHATDKQPLKEGMLKGFYNYMKRGYLLGNYKYIEPSDSLIMRFFGKFIYLFPLRRAKIDAEIRYLEAVNDGNLLDVGCGSGEWLSYMKELGWRVTGLDFDEKAVKVARQKGLKVYFGTLERQCFSSNTFDAVTLNHVIEHLPHPVDTLTECLRILKPSGKLILLTPNSKSLGRRLFRHDWRGLQPPRHLYIYSPESLVDILEQIAATNIVIRPQVSFYVIYKSLLSKFGFNDHSNATCFQYLTRLIAYFFALIELCLVKFNPNLSECMAVIASRKPNTIV